MASTYSGIMDLEVCREWMRFPAECRQSRDRSPQSMCWRIPAPGAQLEKKDPSREGEKLKMLETMTTNSSYVGLEMNSPNAFKEFWFFF